MRSAELILQAFNDLQIDYQEYLALNNTEIDPAQKMQSRLQNLIHEIDKYRDAHPDASNELINARQQLDSHILQVFSVAHPSHTLDSDGINHGLHAAGHLEFLESALKKCNHFQDLANKENLSLAVQKKMIEAWNELKDVIRQIEYLADIRQRLNPNINIRNQTLEDAKEQLNIVESWPIIAKEKEFPRHLDQKRREPINNESGSSVSDRFVLSDQGVHLPPAPNSPLQNGLKIIAATPGQNPNLKVDSQNGFSITKVTNLKSCAEMKTDPQKKDHIRNLDGMIQAYMAGRSPDEIGKPIFIRGEDAESRAILIKLCRLHDYKFECESEIKPISDPQWEKLVTEHFHSHYFKNKLPDFDAMLDRKPASPDPLPIPPPPIAGPPANVQYAKNPEENAVVHSQYKEIKSNYIQLKLSDEAPKEIQYTVLPHENDFDESDVDDDSDSSFVTETVCEDTGNKWRDIARKSDAEIQSDESKKTNPLETSPRNSTEIAAEMRKKLSAPTETQKNLENRSDDDDFTP